MEKLLDEINIDEIALNLIKKDVVILRSVRGHNPIISESRNGWREYIFGTCSIEVELLLKDGTKITIEKGCR